MTVLLFIGEFALDKVSHLRGSIPHCLVDPALTLRERTLRVNAPG